MTHCQLLIKCLLSLSSDPANLFVLGPVLPLALGTAIRCELAPATLLGFACVAADSAAVSDVCWRSKV